MRSLVLFALCLCGGGAVGPCEEGGVDAGDETVGVKLIKEGFIITFWFESRDV